MSYAPQPPGHSGPSPYPQNQGRPGYSAAYPPPRPATSQSSAGTGPYRRPSSTPVFSTPVPRPGERPAIFTNYALPVATTQDLPGLRVCEAVGVLFGTATHPLAAPGDATITARQEAIRAVVRMAQEAGAEAVVGLSFDTYPCGSDLMICATGTGVLVETVRDIEIPEEPGEL